MKNICTLIGIISGICLLTWTENSSWAKERTPGVAFSWTSSFDSGQNTKSTQKVPAKSKYWSGKQNKQSDQDRRLSSGEQTGRIRPVSDVAPYPKRNTQGLRPQIVSAGGDSLSSVIEEIEDSSQVGSSRKSGIGKLFGGVEKSKYSGSSSRSSDKARESGKRIRVSAEPGMQLLQENGTISSVELPASVPTARGISPDAAGEQAPVLVKEDERDLKRRVSVPQSPSSPVQPLPATQQEVMTQASESPKATQSVESGSFVVSNSSPVIEVKTSGPKRIIVGQESVFEIHVRNTGPVAAEKLVVSTEIPSWVEIANITPSRGNSNLSPERKMKDAALCQWRLDTLASGKDEILTMRLIPRQRNNFELTSHYDFEQSAMKAGIEVQEPLIELAIDGRDQIEWGSEDKYRLRVRNTGNGEASNLRLTVTTGDNQQVTHPLGLLKAGEERTMELAVKTHVEDKVNIRIDAAGDYGLTASTSKSITVLRGKIDVYAEVPELQFVNNSVDCLVRIANTGTAPLRNVKVAAVLPSEMKLLSCSNEGQLEPDKGQVVWTIPGINIGQEIVYQMTCQMVSPGTGRLNIAANDATGQSAVSDASIQIEAIASLRVDIKSPGGPIPVGTPIVYEVTVRNDGTKAARDVSAVLFLSKALCPTDVEFGAGMISPIDGKVVFNRIGILGPGQSTSYRVTAQVSAPGNHKVQAVLESGSEAIQLASEAMTYCYEKRTVARRDRENKAKPSQIAQTPTQTQTFASTPVPGQLQNSTPVSNPLVNRLPAAEQVALQTTPKTLPQVAPSTLETGAPLSRNQAPVETKPTQTQTTKPVNNPLLLSPFPGSSANPVEKNTTSLTESALPKLPTLPETKKAEFQPEVKVPETLQPVTDRELGRF